MLNEPRQRKNRTEKEEKKSDMISVIRQRREMKSMMLLIRPSKKILQSTHLLSQPMEKSLAGWRKGMELTPAAGQHIQVMTKTD